MASITAANSVLQLNIANLFPVSQKIQGFATDDAFMVDQPDMAEVIMGVDGKASAGFTPFLTKMTIKLQADSPSIFLFNTWAASQKASREVFPANGSVLIPGSGLFATLVNGTLTKAKVLPDVKKVLGPQEYEITWESVNTAPA